jgi:hypothetical protein
MKKIAMFFAAGGLLASVAGGANAYHDADATYGECISSYNSGDRDLYGPPGQNTYAQNGETLSASEVARLRNEVRKQHCASAKKNDA